jgi:hypothetical protein
VKPSIALFTLPLALACTGSINGGLPGHDGGPAGSGAGPGSGGSGGPGVGAQETVPGRTPMRRLTLTEYTYTIRDLLGEDVGTLVTGFPADGLSADGFDNNGASLEVQTNQLDVFKRAADALSTRALRRARRLT